MFNITKRTFDQNRVAVFSPSVWEPKMGYARGVRVGSLILVAGTVAADERGVTVGCTIAQQTDFVIRKIRAALNERAAAVSGTLCGPTLSSSISRISTGTPRYIGSTSARFLR